MFKMNLQLFAHKKDKWNSGPRENIQASYAFWPVTKDIK